jgi:hypothetical protein
VYGLRVDEGLERASRLPVRLGREVELHLVEVRAADHSPYSAGSRFDGDQGGGRIAGLRVDDGVDRIIRHSLEIRVQGGVDLEPALVDHVVAVLLGYLLSDGIEEVLVIVLILDPAATHVQLRCHSPVVLFLGDVAVLEHPVEHDVAPSFRAPGIYKRIVDAGQIDDPRQKRRL